MSNTTIDGLQKRSSSTTRARGSVRHTSSQTRRGSRASVVRPPMVVQSRQPKIDAMIPQSMVNDPWNELMDGMTDDLDDMYGQETGVNDFLSAPERIEEDLLGGFTEETTSAKSRREFTGETTEGWSDLLGEMSAQEQDTEEAPEMVETRNELHPVEENDGWGDLLSAIDEEEPQPRRKKVKKARKKHHRVRFAVAMLLLVVLGGGVALYFWGDSIISKLTGGRSGLFGTLSALVTEEIPFLKDENGRTNVLVFGTEGYNMAGDSWDGKHDGAQLTDSIMVVSFDQETKDVALLSLPRDLKVSMACSAGKINEVFWCHNMQGDDEEAGARALMKQVGEVLGTEFHYYAHVNWGSLVSIVDTLGGVSVTLDEDINDYGWTGAIAKAGETMHVNGEQALGLARARHGTAGGDFTRGNTQQKIVEGILQKIIGNGLGVPEAMNLLGILGDNIRTNFSAENLKAGARLAIGLNVSGIRQVPLVDYGNSIQYMATANINEISYVVPRAGVGNYSEIQGYIERQFSSDALKREDAKIAVYNATAELGRAGTEKELLVGAGYDVITVGDAPAEACMEEVCIFKMSDTLTATEVALGEWYKDVEIKTAEVMPASVATYGADFIIVLGEKVTVALGE